jgi:hypothetical protein
MRCRHVAFVAILAPTLGACDRHRGQAPAPPIPAASEPASITAAAASPAEASHGVPCGALGCAQYDSVADAFRLAVGGDPLAVGIGEAHAPKGTNVASAAKRFAEQLLPLLEGRASDLLVELMTPPSGCADAAAEVREKQAPATSRQAETNQNEYVAIGERARTLGIVPDMLRPTCADLDRVRAGDEAISASLDLIARLSLGQARRLIDRDARSDADRGKMVVLYGGMLHNDLAPAPESARWSYAPELSQAVHGRFVAIDLVVPEFIRDDETWNSLPWRAHYDRARLGSKSTLFRTGDRSFVLVFPETHPGE